MIMTSEHDYILSTIQKIEHKYGSIENAPSDDPDLIELQSRDILGKEDEEVYKESEHVYAHIGAITPAKIQKKHGTLNELISIEIAKNPDIKSSEIAKNIGSKRSSVLTCITRAQLRHSYYQVVVDDKVLRAATLGELMNSVTKMGYETNPKKFKKQFGVDKHIFTRDVYVKE